MAHIPRRATQHGLYVPTSEQPVVALKPGQDIADGNLYKAECKPYQKPYFNRDHIRDSVYTSALAGVPLPEDYLFTNKPYKPSETSRIKGGGSSGTSHWASEYKATRVGRPASPHYSMHNDVEVPEAGGMAGRLTTYEDEFGRQGSDPRDLIAPGATELPVRCGALAAGTTKGTNFVPGYQGFIPVAPCTKEAVRAASAATPRRIDKSSIQDTIHFNTVGYTGFEPRCALSHRGERKPTLLTTAGKDFVTPRQLGSARLSVKAT
eukprot:TRINITY_DN45839_c0_g1_i1.p1 TRINITY_DN45839_c0_g1~~TRINITY_DN45839_c0_g1_i1.p1  ORF type:complete len:264 (-),score=29.72 TRINITY_DN45839_c0_g1_i1:317-1108(-)